MLFYKSLLCLLPMAVLADQSLEVDSSSFSSETVASGSYITGSISSVSYAINTNTLVISYSTSGSEIVAASGTTVSKSKNEGNPQFVGGAMAGMGVLAGILFL
ncbi:hypothetical protein DASC09_013860 [Saccharomycopsis crataegensis]|uniref:Uncharacterized protein n=1 Tax=Saccharomycopsis crataegensis TaxID=43959 RepID=A0AAV5QHB0_9ASCO|nr:hypothetical protein DASC09_013860 [Saccharomycopsis crataegensis]